jgi:hypothetical protein
LIPDDDNINDWNMDGEQEVESLEVSENKPEESHASLPNLITERIGEGTNALRSQQEQFKFLKEKSDPKDSKEGSKVLQKKMTNFSEDRKIKLDRGESQSSKKDDSKTNENQIPVDLRQSEYMNNNSGLKDSKTNIDLNKSGNTEQMMDLEI